MNYLIEILVSTVEIHLKVAKRVLLLQDAQLSQRDRAAGYISADGTTR